MSSVEVRALYSSADEVADAVAIDLVEKLEQSAGHRFDLVLTGGTVGILSLRKLAEKSGQLNFENVHFWWGDERFVIRQSADRNELQAREAFLNLIPVPINNIHPFPATEDGLIEDAAQRFASEMENLRFEFDLVLLGMGPDGHVASLFPNSQAQQVGEFVVIEGNSPKPPAERLSLSFQAINSAKEIWLIVAGAEKAEAAARAIQKAELPAGKISGKKLTRWYLDVAASSELTSS